MWPTIFQPTLLWLNDMLKLYCAPMSTNQQKATVHSWQNSNYISIKWLFVRPVIYELSWHSNLMQSSSISCNLYFGGSFPGFPSKVPCSSCTNNVHIASHFSTPPHNQFLLSSECCHLTTIFLARMKTTREINVEIYDNSKKQAIYPFIRQEKVIISPLTHWSQHITEKST